MKQYLILLLGTLIITPGQGMQSIVPTASGYNVIRLGENAGITQVMQVGNITDIISTTEPTTFVIGDDLVTPALPIADE